MFTYSLTGCVIKTIATGASSSAATVDLTEAANEDKNTTYSLAASSSINVAFDSISTARFVVVQCLDDDRKVNINMNGLGNLIVKSLCMDDASITSMILNNPSTTSSISVRVIMAGA